MWNAEYNTYGNGSNINLTYKYDQDGTWKKYYNINDRLGNVRTVLRKDGTAGTPVKQFFYTPFGSVIPLLRNVNRTKFIGKEKDKESNYADHGVRKYDDEIGRFTSIDPLWEKYYSLTPYQYAGNNPVSFLDPTGLAIYYNRQGEFANDGVDDGLRYALNDDANANDFQDEKGNYDFQALKQNSFIMPSDIVIAGFMNEIYRNTVHPGLSHAEGAGVEKMTVKDGQVVSEWILGGWTSEKPQRTDAQGDASEFVKEAVSKAGGWHNVSYTLHTHPFQSTGSIMPSNSEILGGDIQTARNKGVPGIAANNKGAVFYNGAGQTAHIPISVFIGIQNAIKQTTK